MVRARASTVRRNHPRLRTTIRRANIILVDDDTLVRTALSRLLRGVGLKVTAFERPSDVLSSLLPKTNACLLLDIYMPEMSGVQLWRELRARGVEIPTILITGQRDARAEHYANEISAIAVLYKPVEELELLQAIECALT